MAGSEPDNLLCNQTRLQMQLLAIVGQNSQ